MSSDLEKFKRRVIRAVARMARKTERNLEIEDKMWSDFQKQVGCDCKVLWKHMRTLTLKKLQRLLPADDKLRLIAEVAQMQLTDWLLFDLVLVHEDINVISEDPESKSMKDLLNLIQMFEIEGKSGEALTTAWTAATFYYNSFGRQCSPMLLQRRWYQLKKETRDKFYKFWFQYRGNQRNLEQLQSKPNILHTTVAQRYPYIITRPFKEWNELIQEKFVILPEEFEAKMRSRNTLPKPPVEKNEPDLVLVEPQIETIDLEVNSDSENETENSDKSKSKKTPVEPPVKIKVEIQNEIDANFDEIDESNLDVNEGNNTVVNTESSDVVAIEDETDVKSENQDTTVAQDGKSVNGTNKNTITDEVQFVDEINTENNTSEDDTQIINDTNDDVETIDDDVICADDVVTENNAQSNNIVEGNSEDSDVGFIETTDKDSTEEPAVSSEPDVQVNRVKNEVDEINDDAIEIQENHLEDDGISSTIKKLKEEILMPHKTDVLDHVNVKPELPEVMASTPLAQSSTSPEVVAPQVAVDLEEVIRQKAIEYTKRRGAGPRCSKSKNYRDDVDETYPKTLENSNVIPKSSVPSEIWNPNSIVKEEKPVTHPFVDIPTDLTFEDDGIELVDDGIEYEEEDSDESNEDVKIKTEPVASSEDHPPFDLKLLMHPLVYSLRLEDMTIFKNHNIDSVRDKVIIDTVLKESKPKFRKSLDKHLDKSSQLGDKTQCSSSDSEDEFLITERNKVPLSSHLLQKPRSRSYNPIQLCKNPDFNTRLKRLSFGFLSSTRNRSLLRTLKPMTIDLSKAFEGKLINGTMYLKSGDSVTVKHEKPYEDDSEQATAVLPLAMPAQSLIDNTNLNIRDIMQPAETAARPNTQDIKLTERQKPINLPDINDIRRINQKLLIAEVTPMRVGQHNKPPVHLVAPEIKIKSEPPIHKENNPKTGAKVEMSTKNYEKAETSNEEIGTVKEEIAENPPAKPVLAFMDILEKEKVIETLPTLSLKDKISTNAENKPKDGESTSSIAEKNTNTGNKPKVNYLTKRPWHAVTLWKSRPELPWNKPKPSSLEVESLLTIDALNKMLTLFEDENAEIEQNKKKNKKNYKKKLQLELRVNQYEQNLKKLDSNEKIDEASELKDQPDIPKKRKPTIDENKEEPESKKVKKPTIDENKEEPESKKVKTNVITNEPYGIFCCWARMKISNLETSKTARTQRHLCPRICVCCCREELVSITKWRRRKRPVSGEVVISDDDEKEINNTINSVINKSKSIRNYINKKKDFAVQCGLDQPIPTAAQLETEAALDKILPVEVKTPPKPKPFVRLVGNRGSTQRVPSLGNIPPRKPWRHDAPEDTVNVDPKPQGHIIIDGRKNLTILNTKNNSDTNFKTYSHKKKEKIVYLNNFSRTEDIKSPIYLGKNRILLTDITLPAEIAPTKTKDIIEQNPIPSSGSSVMVLPPGVQLVMLTSGAVTYTVAPGVELTDEQKSYIPTVIAAVQEQLKTSRTIPIINPNPDDVINLTQEEVVNSIQVNNALVSETLPETSTGKTASEKNTNIPSEIVVDEPLPDKPILIEDSDFTGSESGTSTQNDTKINDRDNHLKTSVTGETENSSQEADIIIQEGTDGNSKEITPASVDVEQEIASENQIVSSETVNSEEISRDTVPLDVAQEDGSKKQENLSSSDENTNRKSLLSDLMEMCGIGDEIDNNVSTIDENITEQTTTIPPPLIPMETVLPVVPPVATHAATENMSTQITPVKPNVPELTPITTFAQLKYACEHNGKFFKLDLETGTLWGGLKVCIKKQAQKLPKSVIDLTEDDDVEEQIHITQDTAKEPAPQEPLTVYSLPNSLNRSLLKANIASTATATPLKLFRSVRILKKNKEQTILLPSPRGSSNSAHQAVRQRKQNIAEVRPDPKSPVVIHDDSSSSTSDYIYKDTDYLDFDALESDESSDDDEPLANVAKRMRISEKLNDELHNESNPAVSNLECNEHIEEPVSDEVQGASKEVSVQNNNETSESLPQDADQIEDDGDQELPEAVVADFLNADMDDGDDDCILGF